ncbi:MAG: HAMP domain-containing sensor histidine kinase [Candidatus Aminicenantes bacterium]
MERRRDETEKEKKRQAVLKSRNFLLFFYLPFLGILIIFFVFSSLNRSTIKKKTEDLVKEQLQAAAGILQVNISHYLKENYSVEEIFESYSGEEDIYYIALLDENKRILGWSSRFEGYLPISLQAIGEEESWVIDSPAGKIFNFFSPFSSEEGKSYFLYVGYSLGNLEEMIIYSRRSFFLIFGLISMIGIVFFFGLYQLQRHYLDKKKEAEDEKKEKERYREISAFTSGVAHEIKNPLNSLSLLCELLHKKVPEELQKDVSLGKEEIQKVSRIIDQFTASLKPLRLNKEMFSLAEIVSDVRESLFKEFNTDGVEISYSESSSIVLNADKGLMQQAFFNLLKNSLEASKKGRIEIRAWQKKGKVLVRIDDPGRGIPEKDKEQIFEPFFSTKKKGMGVGLYLTKKIIETHEGEIAVKSQTGQGTTFFIQIPGG